MCHVPPAPLPINTCPTAAHPSPAVLQTKAFDEEISGLALHPSGYMLLAGFADKLRLMTVLSGAV